MTATLLPICADIRSKEDIMDMHLEWLRIRGFTPATVEARRRAPHPAVRERRL